MPESDGEHAGAFDECILRFTVMAEAPLADARGSDPGGPFGGFGFWLSGVRAQGCGALDEFTKVEAELAECGSHILPSSATWDKMSHPRAIVSYNPCCFHDIRCFPAVKWSKVPLKAPL